MADVFELGTEINLLEHFRLVKPLMGAGNRGDAGGSFVKVQFDFTSYRRGFQVKHARHEGQAVINAMVDFLHEQLIAFKCCS